MDLNYSKKDLILICWKILMKRIIKHWEAGQSPVLWAVGAGDLYRLILHR